MKLIGIRGLLCVMVIFASFAAWAGQDMSKSVAPAETGTLFPPNEFGVSIFGETANGNVDSQPKQNVIHGTNTVSIPVTVAAPVPVPTGSPSTTPSLRKQAKVSFKAGDPSIRKTYNTRRFVTHDRLEHNAGGGGIMLNYYLNRYVGFSLEGDFLGGNPYNTVGTANLIFRYPFEFGATSASGYSKDGKSTVGKEVASGPVWGLAPYIVLGGGAQWDGRCEGIGDVGGGLEFRFKQHYGIFVEGRWVVHDARENYAAETAGFSYNF